MKLAALLENDEQYLYHVTYTKNVPRIKQEGLLQFEPSNWIRGEGGKRYNDEAGIFAFDHPDDAFRWAFKMQWDMEDKDISIVRLNMGEDWEDDPAEDPIARAGSEGRWLRSRRNRKADEIIDSFKFDDFGNPQDLGISQDEWKAQIFKKLRS